MENFMRKHSDVAVPTSPLFNDVRIWNFMEVEEILTSALTLRDLLRWLHDPKRCSAIATTKKPDGCRRQYCCAQESHNRNVISTSESEFVDENSNLSNGKTFRINGNFSIPSHNECVRFNAIIKECSHCATCCQARNSENSISDRSFKSLKEKQKNDRETIRQKLSMADPEVDSGEKTWCHPRAERRYSGNSQNLQICYINDSCSSSDNDENQSKLSPSFTRHPSTGSKTSPTSSPVLSSPGFGIRKSFTPYRMSSSSSTISLTSNSSTGHHTSSSSLPADGEIISMRSNLHSEDTKKPRTRQEELELEARIALTQAHQKARKQAKEERNRNRRGSVSSLERILHIPLDDATRLKIRNRNLTREDCEIMTNGQLQVILNDMHAEKEALNSNLMSILETREDLRTQQDAKLIDIEDFKAMMSVSGPETTV